MTTRICKRCGEEKDLSLFWTRRGEHKHYICKACRNTAAREQRESNPELRLSANAASMRSHRRRSYGITQDTYDAMVAAQDNRCAICGGPELHMRSLAVDHCHTTGKVRGLLCNSCNNGIGKLRDDPTLLRRAIEYLEKGGQ